LQIGRGANGNVFSHNYHAGDLCLAFVSVHGHYPHENLFEGNDSHCEMYMADAFWGQQGPRNTAFRNRLRGTASLKTDLVASTPPPVIADSINALLNSAFSLHQSPNWDYDGGRSADFDKRTTNLWAERNIARDTRTGGYTGYGFVIVTPEPSTVLKDNVEAQAAPDSWKQLRFPASLYLTSRPDFWPADKPWPGIGADVDDFGSGNLVKLPAQDRYEGVVYVPPAAPDPGPEQPPLAPVLLD
jgi:hypothetical protein